MQLKLENLQFSICMNIWNLSGKTAEIFSSIRTDSALNEKNTVLRFY